MAKMPVEKPLAKSDVPASPTVNAEYDARERRYRAEEALRDIERAEKHKKDKTLMKDVKACAKEKMKTYDKL